MTANVTKSSVSGGIVGKNSTGSDDNDTLSDNYASTKIELTVGEDTSAPTTDIAADAINGADLYLDEVADTIPSWVADGNNKAFTAIGTDMQTGMLPRLKAIATFGTDGRPATYGEAIPGQPAANMKSADYLAQITALELPASSSTLFLSCTDNKWSYEIGENGVWIRFTGTVKMAQGVTSSDIPLVVSSATGNPTLTFENVSISIYRNSSLTINQGCELTLHTTGDKPLTLTASYNESTMVNNDILINGQKKSLPLFPKKQQSIMGNFFTSLFSSSKAETPEEEKEKNDRKNFDLFKYDGIRAQKIGQLNYAIKCFTEALNIREDFETMSYLVTAYTAAGAPEKSLDILDRMALLEPEHVPTLLTRVNLLFILDREPEALSACERILELDPANYQAFYLLAKAKRTTGDPLGAIAALTRALALKEDFAEAWLLRAEILLAMHQPAEALPDAEKAVALLPEEENGYLLKGRIHEALGEADRAAADYRQALDLNPFHEEAILLAGGLLISGGKPDEAVAFFDEAIETLPESGKIYAERGRAKNLLGDKEGAFEDLKKALELNPDGEEARRLEGEHNFDNLYKGAIF